MKLLSPRQSKRSTNKSVSVFRRGTWNTWQAIELATSDWVTRRIHHLLRETPGYDPPTKFEVIYHGQSVDELETVWHPPQSG